MYNTQMLPIIQLSAVEYCKFMTNYANSVIQAYLHNKKPQRLGQAFFNHFELDKVQNEGIKAIVDELYELDGKEAKEFIKKHFEFA